MKNIRIVIVILFGWLVQAKDELAGPSVSIIIPCYYKHACHLPALLAHLEQQTVLPDEVIISLSQSSLVGQEILDELTKTAWVFPVILVLLPEKLFAGPNRNIACKHATKDIFVCQDADDLPHPQRVEVIKKFFKQYHADHVMHAWRYLDAGCKPQFKRYGLERIPFLKEKNFERVWRMARFTQGNIAMRRGVFDKVQWGNEQRGQDMLFNREVYALFKECFCIKLSLLAYRQYLSSEEEAKTEEEVMQSPALFQRCVNGNGYSVNVVYNNASID